jgi:hypothetical protein
MRRAFIVEDESDIDSIFPDEQPDGDGTRSLSTRCLSEIEPKPMAWLWPGRIPRGKLTIIAGNPGLGKDCHRHRFEQALVPACSGKQRVHRMRAGAIEGGPVRALAAQRHLAFRCCSKEGRLTACRSCSD